MRATPQPDRIAPFANREEAALLLVRELEAYRGTDAIVLTVPPDVTIGNVVAEHLGLDSNPMPCLEIRHPANRNQSIGSVCLKNVVLHDEERDIPQEYLQYTIARLRAKIRRDLKEGGIDPVQEGYRGKTLIVVSDWMKTADRILACLSHIRKESPARIVVATAVISNQAIIELRALADELIYLVEGDEVSLPEYYFGRQQDDRPAQTRGHQGNISIKPVHHYA